MIERYSLWFGLLIFLIFSMLLTLFQTSILPFISPFTSQPNIWIILVIYLALTRGFGTTILYIYANTLLLHTFTGMPLAVLLSWQILTAAIVYFVRKRIYLPTLSYFLVICTLQASVSLFALPLFSWLADPLPMVTLPWREVLISIAFIPIFGTGVFSLGRFMDVLVPLPISEALEQ